MAVFKCPICKRMHVINQGDDIDYDCPDNATSKLKQFQDLTPTDLLSRNNWNFNKHSTKEDAYRNAGIKEPKSLILIPGKSKELGGGRASKNW